MKKFIIILAFFNLNIAVLEAQVLKINDFNKANHSTYEVKESRFGASISVSNKNNHHHRDSHTRQLSSDIKFEKTGKADLIYNIKQVFKSARMSELINERLMIDLIIEPNTGKISEVSFSLNKATQITIAELEALEDAIKTNVVIKLRKEDVGGSDFAAVSLMIPFKAVLNGTFSY